MIQAAGALQACNPAEMTGGASSRIGCEVVKKQSPPCPRWPSGGKSCRIACFSRSRPASSLDTR